MQSVEDLGFSVMASYEAKLTMVEGVVLGVGAILATGAAILSSRSRSEEVYREVSPEEIENFARVLAQDDDILTVAKVSDENKFWIRQWGEDQSLPWSYSNVLGSKDKLRALAEFALRTGASKKEIVKLSHYGALQPLFTTNSRNSAYEYRRGPGGVRTISLQWGPGELMLLRKLANADDKILEYTGYALSNKEDPNIIQRYLDIPPEISSNVLATMEAVSDQETGQGWEYFDNEFDRLDKAIEWVKVGGTPEDAAEARDLFANRKLDLSQPGVFEALKRVVQKFDSNELSRLHASDETDLLRYMDNEDLIALDALDIQALPPSQYGIRIKPLPSAPYGFDWKGYEKDIHDFEKMPREMLGNIGVYDGYQLSLWRASEKDEDLRGAVFSLAAVVDAFPEGPMRRATEMLAGEQLRPMKTLDSKKAIERSQTFGQALKSGQLKHFNDLVSPNKDGYEFADYLHTYLENLDKFPVSSIHSAGELLEKLDVLMGQSAAQSSSPKTSARLVAEKALDKAILRARDRLAKRDPEWAISEYPAEYRRGKRIAKFLEEITNYVEDLVKKGDTVVVHGRDGELLYDLLMRRPGIDRSKVRYALTSRPMTTYAQHIPQKYRDYLGRMVPKGAVHIDTGFAGSIPHWFDQQGHEVKAIRMVSATDKSQQIPVTLPIRDDERRDLVLSDLEHSAQRLENPTKSTPADPQTKTEEQGGFLDLTYSWAAPGFHARAYGVYDELGLPRLMAKAKAPLTRFEEQTRYRVVEPASSENVEEEDVIAELLKSKK